MSYTNPVPNPRFVSNCTTAGRTTSATASTGSFVRSRAGPFVVGVVVDRVVGVDPDGAVVVVTPARPVVDVLPGRVVPELPSPSDRAEEPFVEGVVAGRLDVGRDVVLGVAVSFALVAVLRPVR